MASSQQQCTVVQSLEHPAVPGRENIAVLEQPRYSPNLSPGDFLDFPKIKGIINRNRFEGLEATKPAILTELMDIQEESFQ